MSAQAPSSLSPLRPTPAQTQTPLTIPRPADLLHTTLPGVTLLAALVFAPWYWGCTWPLGIHLLEILLLNATTAWTLGILWNRRNPGFPPCLSLALLGLLLQGWILALNAHSICDETTGLLRPIPAHLPWLPGSVDQPSSRADMLRITALLGAGLVSTWLGRSRAWRRRLLWTMIATAVSMTLLGCWQRATRATDIFWNTSRHLDFFFATYRNVTNAGEYLNLVLPLAGALTLAAVVRGRQPWRVAAGAVATLLLLTGSLICGSKVAPLVSLVSAIFFVTMNRAFLRPHIQRMNLKTRVVMLLIVAAILGAVVQSVGLDLTADRWSRLFSDRDGAATFSHRLLVDQVCILAAPDAGLTGFGPGAFHSIFPYYSWQVAGDLSGFWRYAHNDYLQTGLEWGLVGSALWAFYLFGGAAILARAWWRADGKTEDRIIAGGLLQAQLAVGLMALIDFPLQIASIQLNVVVLLGLAWSSQRWPRLVGTITVKAAAASAPPNFSCAP